jgi:hypothetical protein
MYEDTRALNCIIRLLRVLVQCGSYCCCKSQVHGTGAPSSHTCSRVLLSRTLLVDSKGIFSTIVYRKCKSASDDRTWRCCKQSCAKRFWFMVACSGIQKYWRNVSCPGNTDLTASTLIQMIGLLTCIQKVSGSKHGKVTGRLEGFFILKKNGSEK